MGMQVVVLLALDLHAQIWQVHSRALWYALHANEGHGCAAMT